MVEVFTAIKCSQANCPTEAEYLCYCKTPEIYLCMNHMHNESNHRSIGIYKPITEFDRKRVIDLCQKCKNDCLSLKSQLMKECQDYVSKITKAACEMSNNIRKLESLYDDLIGYVCNAGKVKFVGQLSLMEKILARQVGNTDIDSPYWEIPKIKLDVTLTVNDKQVDLYKYIEQLQPTTLLTFFNQNTKFAVNVNVRNDCRVDVYYVEDCPENLGYYCGFCYLPDGNLFANSGNQSSVTNFTYILNTTTKKFWKKANSSSSKHSPAACYSSGFVYIFGGLNSAGSQINNAEKYSVSGNSWSSIASFPTTFNYSSAVLFNGEIYCAGCGCSNVHKYKIAANSYENSYSIPSTSNKFLIDAPDKVYLFDNNRLFEYNCKTWELINSSTSVTNGYLYCCPIKFGEFIYFMLNDKYVYRFSFISKKTDKLKSINV